MRNLAENHACDEFIEQELQQAGLVPMTITQSHNGEVPYTLYSEFGPWTFVRFWYYWVAKAPEGAGLPIKAAERLNDLYGTEARAVGFAGGLPNDELRKPCWMSRNDTIDLYHIDSAEGLKAFVQTIKGER